MRQTADVLIVGAGPTGLVMAAELLRHGINCQVIDAAPAPAEQSKALAVHARTLEIFQTMGIADTFVEIGWKLNGITIFNNRKKLAHFSFEQMESPFSFVLSVPQCTTERILLQNLERLGGTVERSCTLTALQESHNAVTATVGLADGQERSFQYSWVIGCDGAHSKVRHCLAMPFEGQQYRETFYLADAQVSTTSLNLSELALFTTEQGLLGVFPLSSERVRVVVDLDQNQMRALQPEAFASDSFKPRPPRLDEVQELVLERGPSDMQLSDPLWLSTFSIHRRQVNSYRKGRTFLAGDAAHVHSPAGGQGMNTGIQDAFNLAWKLALFQRGEGSELLLDSYSQERHGAGQNVLRMTDFFTRVNTLRNPVAQTIRVRLAPVLAAQEVVQHKFRDSLGELSVSYRHSPVVAEHRASLLSTVPLKRTTAEQPDINNWFDFRSGPHPGDRAPDAHLWEPSVSKATTLWELLHGTEHKLLLLSGERTDGTAIRSLIEIGNFVLDQYSRLIKPSLILSTAVSSQTLQTLTWSGSVLEDTELSMHHRYGASSECLYLIRPDGYVAFRSLPAEKLKLCEFLEKIFA